MAGEKTIGNLLIRISADTALLSSGLKKGQVHLKEFERNVSMLKNTMLGLLSAGAIADFTQKSVESFLQSEKSVVKLTTALKGNAKQLKELQDIANRQQSITTFSDEESLDAMTRMRAIMGDNVEGIKQLLPLVQDLAIVKEMQLSEAADLVAKSVMTQTNALKHHGIVITGAAGSTERLQSAVEALTNAYGGQAKALGDTLYGQLVKTRNAFDNIKEAIGAVLAKPMSNSAKAWQMWAEVMTNPDASAWDKWSITFTRASKLVDMYEEKYGKLADNLERIAKIQNSREFVKDENGNYSGAYIVKGGITGKIQSGPDKVAKERFDPGKIPGSMDWSAPYQFDAQAWNYQPTSKGAGQISNNLPGIKLTDETVKKWQENYDKMVSVAIRAQQMIQEANQAIQQAAENMVVGFAESIGKMMAGQKKFDMSFIIESFGQLAVSLGKLMISFGVAGLALKKLMISPATAIIAGAALVALGTAAQAAASNVIAGNGGGSGATYGGSTTTGSENYSFNRNMGDTRPIPIHLTGELVASGENLRLALNRATVRHNKGY